MYESSFQFVLMDLMDLSFFEGVCDDLLMNYDCMMKKGRVWEVIEGGGWAFMCRGEAGLGVCPHYLDYPSLTNQVKAPPTYTLHATTSYPPHHLGLTPSTALLSLAILYNPPVVYKRVNPLVQLMQPRTRPLSRQESSVVQTTANTTHPILFQR
jgi:hypothetical protein